MLTAFILFLADQILKYIIRHSGGFYICNTGISFGIKIPFFLILFIIIAGLVFWKPEWLRKTFQKEPFYATLLLLGAFSNILDRLTLGCVIDFIDIGFWPVFNLADIFISVGGIMILIKNLREDKNV